VVSLSPSSVNFGNVKVGSLSPPQTVTVKNTGNGKVNLSGIGIGGANAHDFPEVNACPQQLPAGTSCNITVYFRPSATGVRKGILGVQTGVGNPQTVPLTGNGT
jgi:centrosomal CEP192-like protein